MKASIQNLSSIHNDNTYYQLGIYFYRRKEYKKAECCFRYAAKNGHVKAKHELEHGIKSLHYLNIKQRINLCAIELLEQLVTKEPTEKQIKLLEELIENTINKIQIDNLSSTNNVVRKKHIAKSNVVKIRSYSST